MKRLFQHKWVVAVGAIVLTLAIGAGAWAATGTPSGSNGDATCSGACVEAGGAVMGEAAGLRRVMGGLRGLMGGLQDDTTVGEIRERMQERHEQWAKNRAAALDRIREEMSAEDQAKLDGLLETAKSQREEIREAAQALRETLKQIRDLVKPYLPAGEAGNGGA